ncbi:hypothetical protein APW55_14290, partial [Staphylococcus aureus]
RNVTDVYYFSILVRGPNTEKLDSQFQQTMQVGVGAPTQRISKRNSTNNVSWGGGLNKEKLDSQFQ